MPGAPLLDFTRCHARARLSLASTACSNSWFVASSGFKARCAPPALASSPGGVGNALSVVIVCSLSLAVKPFSGPTPGHLLRRLLTSAVSRHASLQGALCGLTGLGLLARLRSGSSISRLVASDTAQPGRLCHQHHTAKERRSPQVDARTVGAQAPYLPQAEPGHQQSNGLLMPGEGSGHWRGAACKARTDGLGCHVPSPTASLGLDYAVCSPSPRTFALRLPSADPSRFRPCLRLVVILAHLESKSVLPQGTSTP